MVEMTITDGIIASYLASLAWKATEYRSGAQQPQYLLCNLQLIRILLHSFRPPLTIADGSSTRFSWKLRTT